MLFTGCHNITEILLKVALNTITQHIHRKELSYKHFSWPW